MRFLRPIQFQRSRRSHSAMNVLQPDFLFS
jgi:hypothetical protein